MTMQLQQSDCLEAMRRMPGNSVTAIVTDPPYALEFMDKGWDKVLPSVDVWREALRVLKPGGMLLTFGGTRTYHRLTCNIEDAGFDVRDCLMWLHGQGFPKSLAIDKAIDRQRDDRDEVYEVTGWIRGARNEAGIGNAAIDAAFGFNGMAGHWTSSTAQPTVPTLEQVPKLLEVLGNPTVPDRIGRLLLDLNGKKGQPGPDWFNRAVVGERVMPDATKVRLGFTGEIHSGEAAREQPKRMVALTTAATERSAPWAGYGTALKPAWEPIVVAMKPNDGTYADNALAHGVAGINVDACRIGEEVRPLVLADRGRMTGNAFSGGLDGSPCGSRSANETSKGRWPANVVHDGLAEEWSRFFYCAKTGTNERSKGCEDLITWEGVDLASDLEAIEELARATSVFGVPSTDDRLCSIDWCGKRPMDLCPTDTRSIIEMASRTTTALRTWNSSLPWSTRDIIRGAITTILAAGSSPADLAESTRKWSLDTTDAETASHLNAASALFGALSLISAKGRRGNVHSTVKPLALMRWLVRMVRMPAGTLVLDPFMGSGSTGVACKAEGVDFVGIEREAEYLEIARRRQ